MISRRAIARGFTLVELMASMTVGSIILLLAATMLGTTGDGYERIGGGVGAEREARALLNRLTSDLSTARFHKESVFDKNDGTWSKDRIGFLSLQPSEAQDKKNMVGDLCAVNYYVTDKTIGGRTVRCLMRGFRESNDVFSELLQTQGQVSGLFKERDLDEEVAFGVLGFEARPKVRGENGNLTDWMASSETGPDVIEVLLVIARRDLAGKLNSTGDWNGSGNVSKLVGTQAQADRNGDVEVYKTTIRFGNEESR